MDFFLHVWMAIYHTQVWFPLSWKKRLDPLELGLYTVMNCHEDSGNQAQVL